LRRTALLGLATLAAALSLTAAPTSAQQDGVRLYPWCAYYGNGRESCYFSTFEQCRAASTARVRKILGTRPMVLSTPLAARLALDVAGAKKQNTPEAAPALSVQNV